MGNTVAVLVVVVVAQVVAQVERRQVKFMPVHTEVGITDVPVVKQLHQIVVHTELQDNLVTPVIGCGLVEEEGEEP
jgi:hypothetical protein